MKNRWIILMAGVIVQTVLGGIYSWSTFTPRLMEQYQLTEGQCGFIFGVTIFVFTVAMIFAGRILSKKGPRFTAGTGAVLFALGYFLASFSKGNFWLLLISIGVLSGTGIGFGYVCPLAVSMKWFPDKKGLVTGIAVAGFGGGAVFLTRIAIYYLEQGMDILVFFRWLSIVAGSILLSATMLLADPPDSHAEAHKESGKLPVFNKAFALLIFGIFSGTFAGLLMIGNLTPMVEQLGGLNGQQAGLTVSIFAIGNALGRVSWGHFCDRLSFKSIPISLGAFAMISLGLLFSLPVAAYYPLCALLGFGFGGNFVIYAAAVSRHFGMKCFALIYPICFMGYGIAGLTGPGIGGWISDKTGSYTLSICLSIGLLLMACVITALGLKNLRHVEE